MSTLHLPAFTVMAKSHLHHPPTEVSRAHCHVQSFVAIDHSQDTARATAPLLWLYGGHQSTLLNGSGLSQPKQRQSLPLLVTSAKPSLPPALVLEGDAPWSTAVSCLAGLQ